MADCADKFLIGDILKQERLRLGYTREQIAERAEIGARYLIAIENNEKRPKIDVLCRLIRSLGMSSDKIFWPELDSEDDEGRRLMRLIQNCDTKDQKLIAAMVDTLIDTRAKEYLEQKEVPNK